MRKAWQVFRREYVERVRKKSFLLGTVLGPFLLFGLAVVPTLLMSAAPDRPKPLAVVDFSGRVGQQLEPLLNTESNRLGDGSQRYPVRLVDLQGRGLPDVQGDLNQQIASRELFGYLVIGEDLGADLEVSYFARNASNLEDQETLRRAITDAVVPLRFREAGLEMEMEGIRQLSQRVGLLPAQVGKNGTVETAGRGAQFGKLIAAYAFVFIFYMSFLMWGISIMRGVVEEKNSKVIEVILSSVSSRELMAGKVLGIGAVALTQYLAWAATGVGLYHVMTAKMNLGEWVSSLNAGTLVAFIGYFVLGYLLFASYFAALGACCSTDQEAQQMQQFGVIPILLGFLSSFYVLQNADSGLSTVLSLIPIFTPFLMMVRLAVLPPPAWEVAASVAVLLAGIALLTVVAAKVFRVGILMTGKKPTAMEVWRWIRYA